MSDDYSHRRFFEGKQAKLVITDDTENPGEHAVNAQDERQALRRAKKLSEVVEHALVNRVDGVQGDLFLRVTFDEFVKINKDPEFQSLASYAHHLLNYADGRPRPIPIRPIAANEMGMYRGRYVILTNNPGDGARDGIMVAVKADIQANQPVQRVDPAIVSDASGVLDVEADPFPSNTGFTVVGDEDE
jgi:hypothetical protein